MPEDELIDVPPTLDTATDEEIWSEIRKRSKSALLVILKRPKRADDDMDPIGIFVGGGQLNAVGMARYAEQAIMQMIFDNDPDEEESDGG